MANMNRKNEENKRDDGTYVVKSNRTERIIAFIVCLLIAFAIWVYARNAEYISGAQDGADSPDTPTEQSDSKA